MDAPQREFLQKTAKETKVGIGFAALFVIFASFCWILHLSGGISTEDSEGNEGWSFRSATFPSLTAPARAADCRPHLSTPA